MKKYGVYITYKETRYIEVEAASEEEAQDKAYIHMDSAQPYVDEDYEYEVEELQDE